MDAESRYAISMDAGKRCFLLLLSVCVCAAAPVEEISGATAENGHWFYWLSCASKLDQPCAKYLNAELVRRDYSTRSAQKVDMVFMAEAMGGICSSARGTNASYQPARLKILDVGAGPLSTIGTHCGDTPVELVPVDILAPMYDALLARLDIEPRVRTQYVPMEEIANRFAPNYFDLVTTFNAIDHAQDPVEAVSQMIRVVKPGKNLNVFVMVNESTFEHGFGMHQWNMFADERGHFFIANHKYDNVTDITEKLRNVASITHEYQDTSVHPHPTLSPAQCQEKWKVRNCAIMVKIKKFIGTGGQRGASSKKGTPEGGPAMKTGSIHRGNHPNSQTHHENAMRKRSKTTDAGR